MNVLHLSTADIGSGGVKAALRMHAALLELGHGSRMLVRDKQSYLPGIIGINEVQSLASRQSSKLLRGLQKFQKRFTAYQPDYYFHIENDWGSQVVKTSDLLRLVPFKPDIILAHFIPGFITPRRMYELNRQAGAPVYWIIMDMGPFTGGCHYAWDCRGYTESCGHCPALGSSSSDDRSHRQLLTKKHYFDKTDLRVVACTTELSRQIAEASVFKGRPVRKILLSVNTDIFRPVPRQWARGILNIADNRKVIFFGASMIHERRKGMKILVDSFRNLARSLGDSPLRKEILVAVAGHDSAVSQLDIPFEVKNLGYLADDRVLAAAYQAADLFVCPSIQDSGPLMINESVACGTPVVAFNIGVSEDLIENGRTGYRIPVGDAEAFAEGIRRVLEASGDARGKMSEACRALAETRLAPAVQLKNILDWHNELQAARVGL